MNAILSLLSAERLAEHYAAGEWRDETLYALVKRNAECAPGAFALRDRWRRISYGELVPSVDRVAWDLHRRGVRSGERVAIWLSSRIEAAIAILACLRNGYVCCPSLHRDHTVADIVALLERMRAGTLFAQPAYGADSDRHDIFAAVRGLSFLRHAYALPQAPATQAPFIDLPSAMAPAIPVPNADPNRVVYLAFTSGTSGVPKGVMHSDNTLLAPVRRVIADWALSSASVTYSFSPLSHNLGFGALVTMMAAGGELVLHDLPRGASIVDRLTEVGATYLVGVPTHAIDILSELRARGHAPLGSVTGFRVSGAPVSSAIAAELLARGILPQSGYGMTEAGSHHYTLPDDAPAVITETSGRACHGYAVRIWRQNDPDREVEPGEIGEIGGRGAGLMLGYFDDQRVTEESFNAQGWFMTGDLGWIDDKGYLHITGRRKDVIVRGGHKIYPARIEGLVLQNTAVERAAAFPVSDARLGERLCLAIVLRSGMTATAEQVLQHLDAHGLSKFDMPEYFLEMLEMPLTASGKTLKRELVRWVEEGRMRPQPVSWQPKR